MRSSLLERVKSHVQDMLQRELPPTLTFHNLQHTKEVVSAAEEICLAEGLSQEEVEEVLIAAWFHDTGYIKSYIGHEDDSIAMAREFLKKEGFPENRIEKVAALIDATRYMQKPRSTPEACLKDADNLHTGKINFWQKGQALKSEWEAHLGKKHTPLEWAAIQLSFLEKVQFYTHYCEKNYTPLKEKNMDMVRSRLDALRNEESRRPTLIRRKTLRSYLRLAESLGLSLALGVLISMSLTISLWGFAEHAATIGLLAGVFVGGVIRFFERPYEENIEQKIIFPLAVFVRTGLMGLLFLLSLGTASAIYALLISERPTSQLYQERFEFIFSDPENFFRFTVLTLFISFLLNYLKFTTRIIGRRILVRYLLGRYARPKEEERIFMFVDLNSSTLLAEKLGAEQYHALLTRFFQDISPAIKKTKGEIYQYVGDEVVVTWPMKEGIKKNNCVRCFFEIEKQLNQKRIHYEKEYGIRPDFKVGLHGGRVITAVVGSLKLDVVYHGDVINTCERILNQCIPLRRKFLISEYVVRRLTLAPHYEPEFVTTLKLKGKESEISLYTIRKAEESQDKKTLRVASEQVLPRHV
ncbi:MAG: HD domain-containing protein [Flavobacteriales bacterium]|nr:HD domain-containing protein [Flavobacteriales bacterium]MCX7650605.1 HD domain-containing protein [Flavobacteriales bacterium]MDW8432537.1 HD domain-containing protein [Flavobacteriales bacterium]